jgi:ABC-type oligopeptide transport system substrate-binding subunit
MRVICKTYFDINATGVTGHFKPSRVPFIDKSGQRIENEISWNIARNQQRNWETITQVIGMRTQISKMTTPVRTKDYWEFEFEVDVEDVFGPSTNPTQMLESDANSVPMLVGLWNKQDLDSILISNGARQNIWFTAIP